MGKTQTNTEGTADVPEVTPQETVLKEHIVTEETLAINPDLVGEVEVGDIIQYESEEAPASWPVSTPK